MQGPTFLPPTMCTTAKALMWPSRLESSSLPSPDVVHGLGFSDLSHQGCIWQVNSQYTSTCTKDSQKEKTWCCLFLYPVTQELRVLTWDVGKVDLNPCSNQKCLSTDMLRVKGGHHHHYNVVLINEQTLHLGEGL